MMLKASVLCSQVEQALQGVSCLTEPVLVNTFKYIVSILDCKWEKMVK